MLRQVILLVVTPIAMVYVMNQVRKPTRWVGRVFLARMNQSHSELTDWGLKHVTIEPRFAILDVGCGGGRTIQKMAAIATEGRVVGVDHSIGSVEASRALNAGADRDGRVEVQQASVAQLPFPDVTFDLVTG